MKDDVSEDFDQWVTKKEEENKKFKAMNGEEKLEFLKKMFYENLEENKKLHSAKLSDESQKGNQIRESIRDSKKNRIT